MPHDLQGNQVGLAYETFTLLLNKQAPPGDGEVKQLICKFSYIWDFPRNMGHGTLQTVDGVEVNANMAPLGIENQLDFMTTAAFEVYIPLYGTKTISRAVLDLVAGERKAGVIIKGPQGDEILTTQNWPEEGEHAKLLKEGVKA